MARRERETALHRIDAHEDNLDDIAVLPQPGDGAMNPRRIAQLVHTPGQRTIHRDGDRRQEKAAAQRTIRDEPLHFSPRQLEGYIRAQGMTTHTGTHNPHLPTHLNATQRTDLR